MFSIGVTCANTHSLDMFRLLVKTQLVIHWSSLVSAQYPCVTDGQRI